MNPSEPNEPVTANDASDTGSDQRSEPVMDTSRRRLLLTATTAVSVAGAGFLAWPLLSSFSPSARARAVGGSVTFDVSRLKPGEEVTLTWRGQPVWVLHRTADMLERLGHAHLRKQLRDPDSEVASQQPDYAKNSTRSIRPEYLVVVAVCTHLGCVPTFRPQVPSADLGDDWMGGYFCPCHGSRFDFAGRVSKLMPAPTNLVIPPHHYVDDNTLVIGVDHA